MAVVLALMAALAYGSSDFAAGLASRRFAAGPVTGAVEALTLLTAAAAVILFPGAGPSASVLGWGAVSGLGTALGTLSLYHGFSVARMSVVATLSAVLTAVIPVIVGVALGNHLTVAAEAGIAIAVPGIGLMCWQPQADASSSARAGVIYGVLAGLGFALLFIALDRAGTRAGAWPLVPGQLVALLLIAPFAYRGLSSSGTPPRSAVALTLGAGVLSGIANLLFLAATGRGELAIVAVLTSLYPAATVVLARAFLAERWTSVQAAGLLTSASAIILVSAG
ncbi:MAG: EamA family transporter [Solirubrobacteraceae bacterium]